MERALVTFEVFRVEVVGYTSRSLCSCWRAGGQGEAGSSQRSRHARVAGEAPLHGSSLLRA